MAPADPLDRPPAAAPRAVLGYGVDRVLAAARVVAALAAEQAAEGDAVEQDQEDEDAGHAGFYPPADGLTCPGRLIADFRFPIADWGKGSRGMP